MLVVQQADFEKVKSECEVTIFMITGKGTVRVIPTPDILTQLHIIFP